ncbi:MAG: hypothetical protein A2X49_08770 [Lentisphaerae bacterium GWF2_52_8]|nr:MAG: hypothetical protein A2X49_08770 [Lentisphaerae bacterium GWF2_52_8]
MNGKKESYSAEDKKALLGLARETIEAVLRHSPQPKTDALPAKLQEIASCFVTLHDKDGNLRGCIGNIGGFEPLAENIQNNAISSAFGDPRFPHVSSLEELSSIVIEISILTAPEKIPSIDEFKIGEHGIILQKSGHSAVFLPQVAPEQGWDVPTTMAHLSMKAGLGHDAWLEPGASFEVFRAVVFSEQGERPAP